MRKRKRGSEERGGKTGDMGATTRGRMEEGTQREREREMLHSRERRKPQVGRRVEMKRGSLVALGKRREATREGKEETQRERERVAVVWRSVSATIST